MERLPSSCYPATGYKIKEYLKEKPNSVCTVYLISKKEV